MKLEPPLDWEQATAAHAEHVAAAEGEVTEWAWVKNAVWERLEPIWEERHGRRPNPRRLAGRPKRKTHADLYGFDAAGQAVVCRRFGDAFGNDDVIQRETLRVDGQVFVYVTEGARGVYRHRLGELHVPTYVDGLLVRLDSWWYRPHDGGFYDGREDYVHQEGRLTSVRSRSGLLSLRYADDGELLTVVADNGETVYRRSLRGAEARALKLLRAELPGRVAAWARRVAPDEPVGCVVLQYGDWYENALPPVLALATRREIEALGEDAFSPAEYGCFDDDPEEFRDIRLADAFEVLNQAWRSTEARDQPRRLLVAVAKAVPGLSYPVYALDLHRVDLESNVSARLRRAVLGVSA
jgi:hypothetical protein